MTPERWQQIDQLFHSALNHERGQRAAFIAEACAGDLVLRKEVESLLEAHEQVESFIEKPASDVAAELLDGGQTRLSAGQKIGHYTIMALLGVGGMGEVYLAQDLKLGRQIALKLLPALYTVDGARVRRFEQEARAASALNHPNIVTIHEIGRSDSSHFIATEFIDGETLRAAISRSRLTLRAALDVAIQVASALVAAHKAGIVHRDIKPENIMVRRDDRVVKVLDFGLAKLMDTPTQQLADSSVPTKAMIQTDVGVVMGTVSYMSPEQARGLAVDERTDIWSLGVVLYEMVAGRLPFAGETASDVIAAILKTEPPILSRLAPDVPAELERIVTKVLRKDEEERYQSIKELALDLKSLKQRLEFEAEIERTGAPDKFRVPPSGGLFTPVKNPPEGGTLNSIHTTSSAEYIVHEIKRHQRGALLILATLLTMTAAVAYFTYSRYFASGGTGTIDSVAVLPFTNVSGDPDTEYLSDGMSESLINSLSQLPGVKVIARSSSFKYKGKEVDPQEAARALGVEGVLTGRVLQRGENLLISVELVDTRDRTQVWGEQYNRKATDLLQVQAEISREIAETLRLRLTAGEHQQLAKRETANPQAYELLLKGRFYNNKGGLENRRRAVEYFQQATAVDPTYALAYAELSNIYTILISLSILDSKEFTPKAETAARKALELDESLAEAHSALANLKTDAWDWATAEREYKRAIELNPNLAEAHKWYAFYLSFMGRHEQAITEVERARELDPVSLPINVDVGWILFNARQYNQALETLNKTLELDPKYDLAHVVLGATYAAKGMYAEAIAAYQETINLGLDTPDAQIHLGTAYAQAGERERAQAILKRLQTNKDYVSPVGLAVLLVALGEREQAFSSLERAYAAHDTQLQFLGVDPMFDSLRGDSRFQDLLRRVGLPQ